MKYFINVAILAVLIGGGYAWWLKSNGGHGATTQQSVATAEAELRDIEFAVAAAGEVGPAEQVSVRPEINGRIISLAVDIGDQVKKGDVLFTLDDQELANELESHRTEIDRAKLQLAQTDRNYRRASQLFEDQLISQEEYENFKTESELAQNALVRAQRDLAVVEERLTKTVIAAPFDCTVLARPVSVGQAVSGSGGVGGGTEVLAVADLNEMIIQAHINQADVTRLQVDQEVSVQVEAVQGLSVKGKVERIAPQATIKNNIKGFLARILLRNVDPRIRPGMTATINIPVDAASQVVAVPLSSIYTEYNEELGRMERYAYVESPAGFERRPVEIGLSDFFHAEVRAGIAAGEVVALEPPPPDTIVKAPTSTRPAQPTPSLAPVSSPKSTSSDSKTGNS